ncbi:MAG TPA: hypothetical protein VNF29_16185 [Candidatus Binataceae bacterium]|nr:hypothetical protein [Candidatus Binataceae bacterium]
MSSYSWIVRCSCSRLMGWPKVGLPVGLEIIGQHLDDPMVLCASAAFEAARPCAHRWPPLLERI